MQYCMSTNAIGKNKKKNIIQTTKIGFPSSSFYKKLGPVYEASISDREKKKMRIQLGRFFKKIIRFPFKKKVRISVKSPRHKLTFVPLVNAKSTKRKCQSTTTPEVVHSHNNLIEKIVDISFSSTYCRPSTGTSFSFSSLSSSSSFPYRASDYSLVSMSFSSLTLSNQQSAAIEFAHRIWEEDHSVYPDFEHIVEWIGDDKPFSKMILVAYMDLYDFTDEKLEQSFRILCLKLHLKGETQQIDRILSQFATRYYQCNPECIFGTVDTVHAIVYSILLLNTDLHVAKGDYKKMSRSAFVKNTMDAIQAQIDPPADQNDKVLMDDDIGGGRSSTLQSLEWIPLHRTSSNQSTYSNRSSSYSVSIDFSRHGSTAETMTKTTAATLFGSRTWFIEMKSILKQIYSNIKSHQIATPSTPTICTNTSRVSAVFKRSIGNIIFKGTQDIIVSSSLSSPVSPNQVETSTSTFCGSPSSISYPISPVSTVSTQKTPRGNFSRRASVSSANSSISSSFVHYQTLGSHLQNTELPTVYTSNSPYYKEGMVVRKHLLEKANQKARHRDWRDCFMVVDRSQLRMYKLGGSGGGGGHKRKLIMNTLQLNRVSLSDSASQMSESSSESINVGGGDWLANARLIGSIDLRHTLANMLPSGYSPQRTHVFALQQSSGAVYLFQSGSAEQVQEWVSTCNYWAARESKEPLPGGVSSMEYGWGHCLDSASSTNTTTAAAANTNANTNTDASDTINYTIHEWQAPAVPTVSSMLEESSQLEALLKHVKALNAELDQHRELKSKIESCFSGQKIAIKVMANWEKKSHYLLHEIIKYQNYCDSIEKSLVFQSKIMSY